MDSLKLTVSGNLLNKLCGNWGLFDCLNSCTNVLMKHVLCRWLNVFNMFIGAFKKAVVEKSVVFAVVFAITLAAIAALPREYVIGVSNNESYSFKVKLTTVFAGRNSWEVPWILFGYKDGENYYYLLLHSNGIFELSKVVNGVKTVGLSYVNTTLSPFEEHVFEVRVINTRIEAYVDGVKYIDVEDGSGKAGLIKVLATSNVLFIASTSQVTTH